MYAPELGIFSQILFQIFFPVPVLFPLWGWKGHWFLSVLWVGREVARGGEAESAEGTGRRLVKASVKRHTHRTLQHVHTSACSECHEAFLSPHLYPPALARLSPLRADAFILDG